VEFEDGSIKAQLSAPDMRLALLHGLMYPERPRLDLPRLDLGSLGPLTFEPVDDERYPALALGREAAAAGRTCPAVLSAANEVAVERFLAGEVPFTDVVPLVRETLERHRPSSDGSLQAILHVDRWARETCRQLHIAPSPAPRAGRGTTVVGP
jgi:1-deoxy-D-xylulose-5-phosphate reductoisomerase